MSNSSIPIYKTIYSKNGIVDVSGNMDISGNINISGSIFKNGEEFNSGSNGVKIIPENSDISGLVQYPNAHDGFGSEGEIIYDASKNKFYGSLGSNKNNEVSFKPLGYSFFSENMEGQPPNVQATSFFFFDLTPFSITMNWINPPQYETGITASPSQALTEDSPIVSPPSTSPNEIGGKLNFPVVNRIMIQIKNIETGSYIPWGSKRSPISQYVNGLEGGYVICSKAYPIPPMNSSISTTQDYKFGDKLSGGRTEKVYALENFAESITFFSSGNTPLNSIIINDVSNNPKRIFPVNGETNKELSSSRIGYEIKFWYENEYKKDPSSSLENGWGMTEQDFNVITLLKAVNENGDVILDGGNPDDGTINFLTVQAPSEPQEVECSVAFNNLAEVNNVSSGTTILQLKIKDPSMTTLTDIKYNDNINLVELKFEFSNVTDQTNSAWEPVKKLYDLDGSNTSSATSSTQLGNKKQLNDGIYLINRKRDDTVRYYYVELNDDMLPLTNNNLNEYVSFRVSYKKCIERFVWWRERIKYIAIQRTSKTYH